MKTVTQSELDNVVSSLLVPLQQKNLLVPNVAIAEVVSRSEMTPAESGPPWLLGHLIWRGEQLPVISFEVANSQLRSQDSANARIAVFNAVSGVGRRRFFGLLLQGIPRMIKLGDQDVREDAQASTGQAEAMAVITQLGKASIPDLDYLETLVARLD
ncbi:MAG: chemotaxis protein CheW [Saccharospirillum sp.]